MSQTTLLRLRSGQVHVADSGGDGLPVVLLHGSGMSKDVFHRQMSGPLASQHRLIGIDLPGHGASANAIDPERDYTLPGLAASVLGAMDALQIDRAVIYGWSLGGHIALELMGTHADRLAGVMISGAPPIGRGTLAMLRAFRPRWDLLVASREVFSPHDALRFERMSFGHSADGTFLPAIVRSDGRCRVIVNRSLMRGDGVNQRHVAETSPVPLAVIAGSEDPLPRLSYIAGLHYANLWENQVHIIPDAGHAPFLETPHAFDALLHRFATEVGVGEYVRHEHAGFVERARRRA